MTTKIKLANNVADVDLTTTAPTNGQGLIYNSTSSKWVPGAAGGGGVTTYDTIDDLPLSGVDTGALALVDSTNKLYLWMDTGWYNIATINIDPEITAGNNTPYILATDGTPTVITLIASDPEGIPLTWSYEVTSGSLTNGGGTTATVSNVDNVFTVTPTTTEAYAGAFSLTFKASDGVNLGTTVAAFTLAFRIPDSNYTTLLAKGVAATQNATFVDSSTNAHTITRNGDVYQGAFSPYRAGGYSMYFDGTGDYLTVPASSQFLPGVDTDFTFEAWVYLTATPGAQGSQIVGTGNYGVNADWSLTINSSGITSLYINVPPTGFSLVSSTAINVKEWNHIVACRSGTGTNNLKLFINGVVTAQASTNITLDYTGNNLSIGSDDDGNAALYTGYISNLRLVVGTAVYTSNFTPPTEPLTAINNTSLLINTPYIADSSSNGHAITVNGNTSTQPFSPFNYKVYDEALNGGSAYFDGAGDYLTAGNSLDIIGNDDWTIECWAYSAAGGVLVSNQDGGPDVNYISFTQTAFQFRDGSGQAYAYPPATPNYDQWNHYAIVKNGTTFTFYLNGVGGTPSTISKTLTSRSLKIGAFLFTGFEGYFAGYISNLRIVKGTAVYTANFTPPTSPLEAITNTSLLLNFTNAGIQDYSQVSDLKLIGNATGSSTQVKNAAYSMYFDGTGDGVNLLDSSSFGFGTGDFTIEFWLYYTGGDGYVFFFTTYSGSGNYIGYGLNNGTRTPWIWNNGNVLIGNTDITSNTWQHHAVVRSSGVVSIYLNGSSIGSTTWTTDLGESRPFYIGHNGSLGQTTAGYIEDLRITKGLARYTSNFTPPTSELLG